MNVCKATVRICHGVHLHRDARCFKLSGHFVQIAHTKVDHPLLRRVAKVIGLHGKGCKTRRSGLLLPNMIVVALRGHGDTEVVLIPLRQRFGIMRVKNMPPIPVTLSFGREFPAGVGLAAADLQQCRSGSSADPAAAVSTRNTSRRSGPVASSTTSSMFAQIVRLSRPGARRKQSGAPNFVDAGRIWMRADARFVRRNALLLTDQDGSPRIPSKSAYRKVFELGRVLVVAEMYGPPSDCKGKVQREKVCVNVSGLWVEICSPGLDEIRRVPVLRNPSAV